MNTSVDCESFAKKRLDLWTKVYILDMRVDPENADKNLSKSSSVGLDAGLGSRSNSGPGPDSSIGLSVEEHLGASWILPAQAVKILNVHAETVRRYASDGLIKFKRTSGNHRRYLETDVLRLAEDLRRGRDPAPSRLRSARSSASASARPSQGEAALTSWDISRFAAALRALLASGVSISDGLGLAIQMSESDYLINRSEHMLDAFNSKLRPSPRRPYSRSPLPEALRSVNFPPAFVEMVGAGICSGSLEQSLKNATDFWADQASDHRNN